MLLVISIAVPPLQFWKLWLTYPLAIVNIPLSSRYNGAVNIIIVILILTVVWDVWSLYCADAVSIFLSIGEVVVYDVVLLCFCGVFAATLVVGMIYC